MDSPSSPLRGAPIATYNIFDTLTADHDTLRTLEALLLDTSGNSDARYELWQLYKGLLRAHARAEEKAFYECLKQFDATRELASHSITEHDAIDELIVQCDHIGFDQPSWKPTFERLAHLSDHHLAEEERELFPVAGRVIDEALSAEAVRQYQDHKATSFAGYERDETTRTGVRPGSYEGYDPDKLRDLAASRGIDGVHDLSRSELASALRQAPSHDA